MSKTVMVLGAGIVGVCVAIHLQRRGRHVVLVDRSPPGHETSFGNAGIIQRECVEPYAFPRNLMALAKVAMNNGPVARYDPAALPRLFRPLLQYWWNSAPARYRKIVAEYASVIEHSISEHADLVAASGAESLIRKGGYLVLAHDQAALDEILCDAERAAAYGVAHKALSSADIARHEPALKQPMLGGVHWLDPWMVNDPHALVKAYVEYFVSLGGNVVHGEASSLAKEGSGWMVFGAGGTTEAEEVVLALGPWAKRATDALGYDLPLFVKRGYHMHYGAAAGTLNNWVYPMQANVVLAPMARGIRLTTGAEFAALDKDATPDQLTQTEAMVRRLLPLGERLDGWPWKGARPCTPDMKPVIGPAPKHKGVWFAFGHAHQGLTLAAVTGRMLAEAMTGETPFVDMAPFSPARFG
jgi:D-amino-acid dehydrogenase